VQVVQVDDVGLDGSGSASRRTHRSQRQIRRRRTLPSGRAVAGGLLVVASTVGVFAAYLNATAEPSTAYLVAGRMMEPGTRLTSLDDVVDAFGQTPLDLPPTAAARAIPVEDLEGLVGQVVVAPLERGDLVTKTVLVRDGGVPDAHALSFSLPSEDAVGGNLRAGERIDVVATHGTGADPFTAFVVRGVPLSRVSANDGALGDSGRITLTVSVPSLDDVLALSHAIATAELRVVRSTSPSDDAGDRGRVFRPAPVTRGREEPPAVTVPREDQSRTLDDRREPEGREADDGPGQDDSAASSLDAIPPTSQETP
jgi:hypothetical protein